MAVIAVMAISACATAPAAPPAPRPLTILISLDGFRTDYMNQGIPRLWTVWPPWPKRAAAHWDIVLMDGQMPVMNDPTAVRPIREREGAEGLELTPIIALTANVMANHKTEHLAAGMDARVAKPIQLTDFVAVMQQVLDSAQARQAG